MGQSKSAKAGLAKAAPKLKDRLTPELVVVMVGPVASGCTTVSRQLERIFQKKYEYQTRIITLSSLIPNAADCGSGKSSHGSLPGSESYVRIRRLQCAGDSLRKKMGADYLARLAIEQIHIQRKKMGGIAVEDDALSEKLGAKPLRIVHFLDSVKNEHELETIKSVYRDACLVFGVMAAPEERRNRLLATGMSDEEIDEIIDIDEFEEVDHGQRVRALMSRCDFFVRNDGDIEKRLLPSLERFVSLIFDSDIVTPTQDEIGMAMAAAAADASACLSRQVGAALYSQSGELLSVGVNDVPRFGGGLYSTDDGECDKRCAFYKQYCSNDMEKTNIMDEIVEEVKMLVEKSDRDKITQVLYKSRIRDLIEFSRAVHAEMEALLAVARKGAGSTIGSTLYSTTFPCHSCARHIVAAGVHKVIYIDPYPKSKAKTLHDDAVSTSIKERGKKCVFLQYEGVAPRMYDRVFRARRERKDAGGKTVSVCCSKASPVYEIGLDGFPVRELIVVDSLRD